MSLAKLNTSVFAARKGATLNCERGHPIAKGEKYIWYKVGFRSRTKHVRCMRPEHAPRDSERESSILSEVYAAQESARDSLDTLDPATVEEQDLNDIITAAAESVQAVAEQYREAAEAFGGAGDNADRADTLEGSASEMETWSLQGSPEGCGQSWRDINGNEADSEEIHEEPTEGCDDCADKRREWGEEAIEEARELIDGIELP
jgi:hypothetical protein